jgi:DNA N-6-adenine-methyltransferase (Dam)
VTWRFGGFGFAQPTVGNTNDWLTPLGLLQELGPFDLDPCGCPGMPWRIAAITFFLPEHDGLTEPWLGRVFCNPPYGPIMGGRAQRMAEHRNGIMLIFLRTDTTTWQRNILPFADAILLLEAGCISIDPLANAEKAEQIRASSWLWAE